MTHQGTLAKKVVSRGAAKRRAEKSTRNRETKNIASMVSSSRPFPPPSSSPVVREVILVGLLGIALFCFVAVLAVIATEMGYWRGSTVSYLGNFGVFLGQAAFTWFGVAGLALGGGMILAVIRCWYSPHKLTKGIFVRETVRTGFLVLFLATVAWIWYHKTGGGIVGSFLGEPGGAAFGSVGTGLFASLACLVLLPQSVVAIFTRGSYILSTAFFCFLRYSLFKARKLTKLVLRTLRATVKQLGQVFSRLRWPAFKVKTPSDVIVEKKVVKPEVISSKAVISGSQVDPTARRSIKKPALLLSTTSPVVVLPKHNSNELSWEDFAAKVTNYSPPPCSLLTPADPKGDARTQEDYETLSRTITQKLLDFQIAGQVTHIHPGPVITLFEFEPVAGVKVGKISALADDLAMSLRASSLRILAPIPGQGTVGIEVPNKYRETVRLREVLESDEFLNAESSLTVPLGQDTHGQPVVADIAKMPHLLIAGATGTGKSVCINSLLLGLLFRASPSELGLILIDPKILELSVYSDIPHLRVPVVTVAKQARAVLQWAVGEMERRYRLMQKLAVRSIDNYNETIKSGKVKTVPGKEDEELHQLQKIVIVIDELADLMLQVGRDIEELITRLAQKARASGIHLIVATQRPSVDVITGLIKANFPARLSFRTTSRIDSRTILDQIGAERLLGKGDMLYMPPGAHSVKRIHGAFVTDEEVTEVVAYIKSFGGPQYDPDILEACEKALEEDSSNGKSLIEADEYDALYDQAVQFVLSRGNVSTSLIQRYFRIGYNRAARLIELMERQGIVGPMEGSRPREVFVAPSAED
jgi:hypothetical protein